MRSSLLVWFVLSSTGCAASGQVMVARGDKDGRVTAVCAFVSAIGAQDAARMAARLDPKFEWLAVDGRSLMRESSGRTEREDGNLSRLSVLWHADRTDPRWSRPRDHAGTDVVAG